MFGLGYAFAHQIQSGIREAQQWVLVAVAIGVATWLIVRYERARRRSGMPVGPPVMESDDVPLPSSDLRVLTVSPDTETASALAGADTASGREPIRTDNVGSASTVGSGADDGSGPRSPVALPAQRSHDPVMIDLDAGQPHSSIESPLR
jgi:hypothetical protein